MDDLGVSLTTSLHDLGRRARDAATALAASTAAQRTLALTSAGAALRASADAILEANALDLQTAEDLPPPMRDRLALNPARLAALATGVEAIAATPDPVGLELDRWTPANGLDIARVSVPIGVLAMIYEARPGVTADAAALCVRSANAVILRPGRECLRSALAIHAAMADGISQAGLPKDVVQMISTSDRRAVDLLLQGLDGAVDLLIPRGGRGLVERVERDARIPVLSHREGLNHTFVHAAADRDAAVSIVLNAKMRRVSVCGATETLLIDRKALHLLPAIADALTAAGCELRGDAEACEASPGMTLATEADFRTEHLSAVLSVAVVSGLEGAIDHIRAYGTGHTEAIITQDAEAAELFLREVDASIVLVNASTQFADGGEFGFGGEIGIATGRLHARGPIGARQLTTFKYVVRGTGQTRP